MKRLGENKFLFKFSICSHVFFDFLCTVWPFVPVLYIILLPSYHKTTQQVVIVVTIFSILGVYWRRIISRWLKSGVIIDKDKYIVKLHKLTWNFLGPCRYEEIPMSEIKGTYQDITITTNSKLHNVVLQGKFGSRRFRLIDLDDWNLFSTLLYGE